MAGATVLPVWAVYAVSLGTPASAFVGVMVTGWLNRRTATELERRSRREEVMRLLRWASELALVDNGRQARLGVEQLSALTLSKLLGDDEKAFVEAALECALVSPAEGIEESEQPGEELRLARVSPAISADENTYLDLRLPGPEEECTDD